MMNPKKKAAWVEALRSGMFRKGQDLLNRKIGEVREHCCLGVFCVLEEVPVRDDCGVVYYSLSNPELASRSFPPMDMMKVWGLSWDAALHLSAMNDTGKSFGEIADYIESNPLI